VLVAYGSAGIGEKLVIEPGDRVAGKVPPRVPTGPSAFIRWRGHGTGRNGRFELFGAGRLRVDGGRIVENFVHFYTAAFETLVGAPLSST